MSLSDRQTEEKIFEAATKEFELKGLDGTRMQNIADRAGINKALLHYYFRTKEKLFEAVFLKVAKELLAKFNPVFEQNMSLEEKIYFFYNQHISFLQENPRLPAFVINEINNNPQRIKKIINSIDIPGIWNLIKEQHGHELHKYNISEKSLPQLLTSIVSISIFPFAAKGIFEIILKQSGSTFEDYIEERKSFAAEFVIRSIKKNP